MSQKCPPLHASPFLQVDLLPVLSSSFLHTSPKYQEVHPQTRYCKRSHPDVDGVVTFALRGCKASHDALLEPSRLTSSFGTYPHDIFLCLVSAAELSQASPLWPPFLEPSSVFNPICCHIWLSKSTGIISADGYRQHSAPESQKPSSTENAQRHQCSGSQGYTRCTNASPTEQRRRNPFDNPR